MSPPSSLGCLFCVVLSLKIAFPLSVSFSLLHFPTFSLTLLIRLLRFNSLSRSLPLSALLQYAACQQLLAPRLAYPHLVAVPERITRRVCWWRVTHGRVGLTGPFRGAGARSHRAYGASVNSQQAMCRGFVLRGGLIYMGLALAFRSPPFVFESRIAWTSPMPQIAHALESSPPKLSARLP